MNRRGWTVAGALSGSLLLAGLYRFPPDQFSVYPPCPFHLLTGLQCPGCGATRALAALLHGNLAAAWHWNALFVLLVPVMVGYGAVALRRKASGKTLPDLSPFAFYSLLAASMLFGVLRNR